MELLRGRNVLVSDPEIIAETGWTTGDLRAALHTLNPRGPYDLVTLLIGVNNQFQGLSRSDYQRELAGLIAQSVKLTGNQPGHVLIVSIPDWGVMPFAEGLDRERIGAEIDRFNKIKRDESARAGVHFVDITAISRRAAADPTLVAEDKLHPSGKMYTIWADTIAPVAESVLTEEETQ